jgi:hypothetical protein
MSATVGVLDSRPAYATLKIAPEMDGSGCDVIIEISPLHVASDQLGPLSSLRPQRFNPCAALESKYVNGCICSTLRDLETVQDAHLHPLPCVSRAEFIPEDRCRALASCSRHDEPACRSGAFMRPFQIHGSSTQREARKGDLPERRHARVSLADALGSGG